MKLFDAMQQGEFALLKKDMNRYKALALSGEAVDCSSGKIEIHANSADFFGITLSAKEVLSENWEPISRTQLDDILWKRKPIERNEP